MIDNPYECSKQSELVKELERNLCKHCRGTGVEPYISPIPPSFFDYFIIILVLINIPIFIICFFHYVVKPFLILKPFLKQFLGEE